jgi:hypothetical protein
VRRAAAAAAGFNSAQHLVADVRAADAGVHDGQPGDDLPAMDVDGEDTLDDITLPTSKLEAIRAPADF